MGSLQIEGEIEGINEKQINFIRDVLEKRGFKDNKVVFEPVGKAGDNFVANVKRISAVVEGGKDFKIIAKFASDNEVLRQMMNTRILFNNEIIMYEQVLPKFTSLQRAADVPEEDLLKYAKCYGCLSEEPNEVILLEDLNESDYGMLSKFAPLTNEAVKLVLKNLATIHSLSYALKKLEPGTYESFTSKLFDMWSVTNSNPEFTGHMVQIEEAAISVLADESHTRAIRGVVSQLAPLAEKTTKADKHSRHLVIQQGDGWTNNILFKLQANEVTDCVMIDYQVSREANPACDVLYMIFNCTDHITRSEHYHEWIDYYHEQLDESLSNYGLKANYVYPKDQLDADLKRYSKIYFGMAVMLISIIMRKPEEAKIVQDALKDMDMDAMQANVKMDQLSMDTVMLFRSRVIGLIESCRMFGYLP